MQEYNLLQMYSEKGKMLDFFGKNIYHSNITGIKNRGFDS